MELIIQTAQEDERIRAALLVGSRANPAVPRDKYQDYDITYFVKDVSPFYDNPDWIQAHFGRPAIMQAPEKMTLLPPEGDGHYTYLMIFEDGCRIDLSFVDKPYVDDGEPAIPLLDKDGILPALPPPSDRCWHIQPPTPKLFSDCCNEFWWCLNNAGKGVARDELPYVMQMFNVYVRDMLDQMLDWYIGADQGFAISSGKAKKYFKRYLPPNLYELYVKTYSDGEYYHIWAAVFTACDLFHTAALYVAEKMGYRYNEEEEQAMRRYLIMIKENRL